MKVTEVKASDGEVTSTIDLDLDRVPSSKRSQVKRDVGEFLVEKTQEYLGGAKSPVSKEKFPGLSPSYRAFKVEEGLPGRANLEFEGDLRDSLKARNTRSGVKIGHFRNSETGKADGHNNFTGESNLPQRRYLPDVGQSYKREIKSGVEDIIRDAVAETVELSGNKLRSVKSKTQLWDILKVTFPNFSRKEIRESVKRSPSLADKLLRYNLLRFLD